MTSRVQDYLRQRRALGYKLFREGRQRLNFAHYADRGQRLQYGAVNRVFIGLSQGMIPANGRRHVRLHDLRHTFACRVLLRWQRRRRGAAGRVVILSRYLGHVHIRDTCWYLTAVPELLKQAAGQFVSPGHENP
jgi:integrase